MLALAILVLGIMTAIGSVKTTPAEALIWGLPPKQFMAVPFISVLAFAGFVVLGIVYRKKPDIHRAMMFFGTMTAMSAAVSRIDPLNNLYLGTAWERWFGPYFFTFVLGIVLLAVRCALIRRFDRYFAYGLAGMIAVGVFIMNIAPTRAWKRSRRCWWGNACLTALPDPYWSMACAHGVRSPLARQRKTDRFQRAAVRAAA
ncbi:MAG: hypothetical protein R3C45_18530 [Phycisphaerales bacterium]